MYHKILNFFQKIGHLAGCAKFFKTPIPKFNFLLLFGASRVSENFDYYSVLGGKSNNLKTMLLTLVAWKNVFSNFLFADFSRCKRNWFDVFPQKIFIFFGNEKLVEDLESNSLKTYLIGSNASNRELGKKVLNHCTL